MMPRAAYRDRPAYDAVAQSLSGVLSATLLGRWFPAHRLGVALAVAWSASGVGAMVMLPLAQHLIVADGWRHAYIVFAIISAGFIPLLLVLPWRRIERGARGLARLRATTNPGPTVGQARYFSRASHPRQAQARHCGYESYR